MSNDSGPWHDWQREHSEALAALQETQRAYHRGVAAQAFGGPSNDPGAIARHKALLEEVEAARIRLDQVRARRPRS